MNRIGPKLHSDRPKVVAFGGGKGGTGRSTMCAEVARSFARQKQRVLCVDASWSCPTLNVLLHAEQPHFDFREHDAPPLGGDDSHIADFILETERDNIWMTNVAAARQFPFVRPRLGADVLIRQLHELDFDWILLDLSPGLDPFQVGLFTLSDIPIIVCSPEPASVRMSTQYLRSAFYQAIGYHPDAPQARDEVLEMLYEQPLEMNLDSLVDSARDSEEARHVVLDTADRFDTYLVVNLVREGSERDLGFVLAHAWHRELNIFPRVLASIDYEDRRWFYNRRTTGLGPGRGDEAFSRDTEKLAKNLLDISLVDARYPRPVPRGEEVHPALRIGISKDTMQNEVRQRCRRLWEGYRREESLSLVFSDPDERMEAASELEKLYRRVLTMSSESFQVDQPAESEALESNESGTKEAEAAPAQSASKPASSGARPRKTKIKEPVSPGPPEVPSDDDEGEDEPAAADEADSVERDERDEPDEDAAEPTQDEADEQPSDAQQGARPRKPSRSPDRPAEALSDGGAQAEEASASDDADTDGESEGDGDEDVSVSQLRNRADSPGELVASLRREAELSLHDLSQRTHIGVKYLAAIEDVDLEVLPRTVYLRGYLREICRIFDVDAQPIIDEYFAHLDAIE